MTAVAHQWRGKLATETVRSLAVCLIVVLLSGCGRKQQDVQVAPKPRQATAPTPAPSSPDKRSEATSAPATSDKPSEYPAPAQVSVNYESDPLYQQAQSFSRSDIRKSMELLETSIAKAPDNPNTVPYYLLLGRLKKEFENCQGDFANSSLAEPARQCAAFTDYAQARKNEYLYNEVGGDYLYGGFQFQELEKRFPSNPLAIEAAYEMTKLSQGGECEGFLDCYIENGFARVHDFLLRYPDTPHTSEAIKRADDAFRNTLWGDTWKTEWTEIKDPNKTSDYYDPQNLKRLVQEYEELAEKLPVRSRASCWETVAYYRYKFGENDHAKALYQRILKENPEYENNNEIRKQLSALQ